MRQSWSRRGQGHSRASRRQFFFSGHGPESTCQNLMCTMSLSKFTITLIRHGETDYNALQMIQGQKNEPLNANGIRQVKLLAATAHGNLADHSIIYSSDLVRAYDTARILLTGSTSLGFGGRLLQVSQKKKAIIIKDERLRERCFGQMEGAHKTALLTLALSNGITASEYTPKGGETKQEVKRRIVDFIENRVLPDVLLLTNRMNSNKTINPKYPQQLPKVAVVTHGGVLGPLVNYLQSFSSPRSGFSQIPSTCPRGATPSPPNTSVSEFVVTYGVDKEQKIRITEVTCIRFHDVSHLTAK